MEEHSTALTFLGQALKIQQETLPPSLATTYNNICMAYYSIENHPTALTYYQQALAIRQKCHPPNHPQLAMSYNSMGIMHKLIGDYSVALSCYERILEIQQKALISPYHSLLVIIYNNMTGILEDQYRYQEAIEYPLLSIEIAGYSLRPDHPDTQIYQNCLKELCRKL